MLMFMDNIFDEITSEVAKSADLCLKPWRHSVLLSSDAFPEIDGLDIFSDLTLRIECRDANGERFFENDLELEMYRSGDELNITIGWYSSHSMPILWQGKHSVWMEPNSGKRCNTAPERAPQIEAFARRLRSRFSWILND